jgi:adenine-specific DNA-methyltransferase
MVYIPEGQVLRTILEDVGTNKTANDETIALFGSNNGFDYPKPESLIQKLLELVTEKGDLILDSFLGSGTTAAVAHKMGRKYIGIELGEHAKTHCYPRLKAVVDGEQGGISKAVNWQGGGGFNVYTLAPPLLTEDIFGNMVINAEYHAQMLAAAMAKHEGFTFQPNEHK